MTASNIRNTLMFLSVEDSAAVLIRDGKVEDIQRIEDYRYMGLPVVDERGMALLVKNKAELEKFFDRSKNSDCGKQIRTA